MRLLSVLGALLLCCIATGCLRAAAAELCEIRVVLADSAPSVMVGGELDWSIGGKSAGSSTEATEVKKVDGGVKAILGDKGLEGTRLIAHPRRGHVRYGGNEYRGRLELFVGKGGGVVVLNVLPLEDYLMGVVPSEMPSSWPQDALRAQAVAARTYAVSMMLDRQDQTFDVYSTVADQAYHGVKGESKRASEAVQATAGQIVTFNGKPIVAYYCSDAGGSTKCGTAPYLQSVPIESPDSPHNAWKVSLTRDELAALVEKAGGTVGEVKAVASKQDPQSGHLIELVVTGDKGKHTIGGNKLRTLLGLSTMKSTRAWIEIPGVTKAQSKVAATSSKSPIAKSKGAATQSKSGKPTGVVEVSLAEHNDSRAVSASKSSGEDADSADGTAELEPHMKPWVAFAGGRGGIKLRGAFVTDGKAVVSGERLLVAAASPVLAVSASMVEAAAEVLDLPVAEPAASAQPLQATSGNVGPEGIVIHGRGYGHGVGLSQWGAKTLAERGMGYEEILTYFYKGVRIQDVPGSLGAIARGTKPANKPASPSADREPEAEEATPVFYTPFAPGR